MLWRTPAIVLLVAVGCAGPLTAHREHVAHAAVARAPLSLRLVEGNLRVLASGTLGDDRVTWMIDTGASRHSITPKQATQRALQAQAGTAPTPVLGITGWQDDDAIRPVAVSMLDVRQQAVTVHAGQEALEAAHVAGILSPERLASEGGAVEIDLARLAIFRLASAERQRAIDELVRRGVRLEPACISADECVPMVHATVGDRAATLIVDTGAPVTVLFSDSAAGAASATHATSHVYAWSNTTDDEDNLAIVPVARVRVGTRTMPAKHLVVWSRPDGFGREIDGMIGMDVLRGCTLLLDAGSHGAMACEAPAEDVDTAPVLGTLRAVPTPRLAPHAAALAPGTVARLGCETITDADLSAWAGARDLPAAQSRAAMVRQKSLAKIVREAGYRLEDAVSDDRLALAVKAARAEHHLEDDAAFEAELARGHLTRESFRLRLSDQLLEVFVAATVLRDSRVGAPTLDALVARTQDRLARVDVERDGEHCTERWPRYWSEQIAFEGLSASDEQAVRMELARWTRAGVVVPAVGTPWDVAPIVNDALNLGSRGVRARVSTREDGAVLRVSVALTPQAVGRSSSSS